VQNIVFSLTAPLTIDGAQVKGAVQGTVSAGDADGDAVTYKIKDNVKHGQLDFDEQTGQFTYTAGADFSGYDRFTFVADDGIQGQNDDGSQEEGTPAAVDLVSHDRITSVSGFCPIMPDDNGHYFYQFEGKMQVAGHDFSHGHLVYDDQYDRGNDGIPDPHTQYVSDDDSAQDDFGTVTWGDYGNVQPKPFDILFRDENGTIPDNGRVTYFAAANDRTSTFQNSETNFVMRDGVSVSLDQQGEHGTATLNSDGSFSYAPKDPQGDPYYGWDFFSMNVHDPEGFTFHQWIQLDVGDYVAPVAARPEEQWQPQQFPNNLKGLWQRYMDAKQKLGQVIQKLADFGQSVDAVVQAGADNDALQEPAIAKLDEATQAFDQDTRTAQDAFKAAGDYMKNVWYTSQADFDVFKAIQSLPADVAGLTPSKQQMQKWQQALGQYDSGADFMLANNEFVLKMATEVHDALNVSIAAAGAASLAVTGAQILVKEGCEAFVQAALKQMVNTAAGTAAGYVANSAASAAVSLANRFGINVDPNYLRAGADAIQLFFLVKAARAQRKAAGANCFAAGTLVAAGDGSEIPIEQIHIGQRVATEVFATGAGAPPAAIGDANATQVDPLTWREVDVDMPDPGDPGNDYRMQLLESLDWIAAQRAASGAEIYLDIPELGIHGDAHVDAVRDCPAIDPGNGRVVLGTFQHVSHDVVEVKLVGSSSPLQVTSGHRLWSLDRSGWVAAGDVRAGEKLASERGPATVEAVSHQEAPREVFNLDVDVDHRYFAGGSAILAHNADPCGPDASQMLQSDRRTFKRWLVSMQHQAAQSRGASGARSVGETNAIIDRLRADGWSMPRGVEENWVGGTHINAYPPDGGAGVHLPVPKGFTL
jgi:hypothetical protein